MTDNINPRQDEAGVPWCQSTCPYYDCEPQKRPDWCIFSEEDELCEPAVREMAAELAAATELLRSECTGQGARPLYGLNEELGQAGYWYRGQWIGGEIRDVIRAAAKEREGHDA